MAPTQDDQQPGPRGAHGTVAEAVLPALVWVIGLQAWRAGVVLASGGGWLHRSLVLLVFVGLPVARSFGRWMGARRAAALWALLLAILRVVIQIVGPGSAPVFAMAGVALFAGYLDLFAASRPGPRPALHGLVLGFSLALCDRLLTDTVDLFWLTGVGAMLFTLVLALPVIGFAIVGLAGSPGGLPEQSPLGVALPLVVVVLQMAVAHPSRVGAWTGFSTPSALLLMAFANVVAAGGIIFYEHVHVGLHLRKTRAPSARVLFVGLSLGLAFVTVSGLLHPAMLVPSVLAAPPTVALCLLALVRTRPIGRQRLVGDWSGLSAWWLAAALSALAIDAWWPAAVAVALLEGLALVALLHQDRPEEAPEPWLVWPTGGHVLLLLLALLAVGRVNRRGVDLNAELKDNALRIVSLDIAAAPPQALQARLAELRALHSRLVLVRGLERERGDVFEDGGYWLARRMRLIAFSGRRARGSLEMLAAARPSWRKAPDRQALYAGWRLKDSGLAVALVDARGRPEAIGTAAQELSDYPRRILCGTVDPALAPTLSPPADYTHVPAVHHGDGEFLLTGPGIVPVASDEPGVFAGQGLTALLEVRP